MRRWNVVTPRVRALSRRTAGWLDATNKQQRPKPLDFSFENGDVIAGRLSRLVVNDLPVDDAAKGKSFKASPTFPAVKNAV
jgi:hypothetical protein